MNICVIRNTNFTKDCKLNLDNVAYIDVEEKQYRSRKLKVGDIIIEKSGGSDKQPVGRVVLFDIEDGNFSFSNFTSTLRIKSDIHLNSNYLHKCLYAYYLKGETFKLQSKTTGLHNLDMKGYLRLPIPIPPLSEQERIVEELDCLSGVIEKKNQQLKELDALAQSIFYEMFGNPVENDRGWEVKKLGEVCNFSQGIQIDVSLQDVEQRDGWNRFLRIVDYTTLNTDIRYVNVSNEKYFVKLDDVVVVRYGASAGFVGKDKEGVLANNLFKLNHDRSKLNYKFLYYLLSTNYYKNFVKEIAFGAAMPALSFGSFKLFEVYLPPLSLQQQFAEKIEKIEKQKELIRKSIEEMETLFSARMDYYFN